MAFLDGTRVTRDALPPLVPPCAATGHARRAAWRMEGKPRTARRLPVDPPGPLPTPAARRGEQARGGWAFPPPPGARLMPPTPPPGQERTLAPARAHQARHARRRRIAPGHRRVKRWRRVTDRIRLGTDGSRDVVMARCGARHHCRGRLTPWPPMVESG